MYSHHDKVEMNRRYRIEHDMMGYCIDDFYNQIDGIKHRDLHAYEYPSDLEIQNVGLEESFK